MNSEKENALTFEIQKAQEIANRQNPEILGNVFRYPLNSKIDCDPDFFAMEDVPAAIPIIYAEFRFVHGVWIFEGIK